MGRSGQHWWVWVWWPSQDRRGWSSITSPYCWSWRRLVRSSTFAGWYACKPLAHKSPSVCSSSLIGTFLPKMPRFSPSVTIRSVSARLKIERKSIGWTWVEGCRVSCCCTLCGCCCFGRDGWVRVMRQITLSFGVWSLLCNVSARMSCSSTGISLWNGSLLDFGSSLQVCSSKVLDQLASQRRISYPCDGFPCFRPNFCNLCPNFPQWKLSNFCCPSDGRHVEVIPSNVRSPLSTSDEIPISFPEWLRFLHYYSRYHQKLIVFSTTSGRSIGCRNWPTILCFSWGLPPQIQPYW